MTNQVCLVKEKCPKWVDIVDKVGFGQFFDVRFSQQRTFWFRRRVMPGRFKFFGYLLQFLCIGSGEIGFRWRYGGELGQPSEVLDGGGQQKLVLSAREPSQPEPFEAEMALEVGE